MTLQTNSEHRIIYGLIPKLQVQPREYHAASFRKAL